MNGLAGRHGIQYITLWAKVERRRRCWVVVFSPSSVHFVHGLQRVCWGWMRYNLPTYQYAAYLLTLAKKKKRDSHYFHNEGGADSFQLCQWEWSGWGRMVHLCQAHHSPRYLTHVDTRAYASSASEVEGCLSYIYPTGSGAGLARTRQTGIALYQFSSKGKPWELAPYIYYPSCYLATVRSCQSLVKARISSIFSSLHFF